MEKNKFIHIRGAQEHNLKNVDVKIPHGRLTVITGVSGSGKSSLAYDTLYAEGMRRYVESLSTYARQFIGKIDKPKVDFIQGLAPTVAIRQKSQTGNARSTVGTVTEIYDYLKLLFARVGKTISPVSGEEVKKDYPEDVVAFLRGQKEGSRWILSVRFDPGTGMDRKELLRIYKNQGFSRLFDGERICEMDEALEQCGQAGKDWYLVIDRLTVEGDDEAYWNRVYESVETAFFQGHGELFLTDWETKKTYTFSSKFEKDGMEFPEPSVHLFSFNNPYGACPVCEGYGSVIGIDEKKVIPDTTKSVFEGAVAPWTGNKLGWYKEQLILHAHKFGFPVHKPWFKLSDEEKKLVWEGNEYFTGINDFFKEIEQKSYKIQNRVLLSRYRGRTVCPACGGKRLRKEAFYVQVAGKNIGELVEMSLEDLKAFFDDINLSEREMEIARRILEEIKLRLDFLVNIGLGYLTLNRPMMSLSGGETQRVRLAVSLGSGLTGAIYVLDEPSIGLHVRDTKKLIRLLKRLRDRGNTVVVVEHDEDMMREADYIIDMGPGAGVFGGEVVAGGTFDDILKSGSLTAQYLKGEREIPLPRTRRKHPDIIRLIGVRHHNLKNVDVEIPLHQLVVVTGVSGSGKSSLIAETLYPALHKKIFSYGEPPGEHSALEGAWKTIKNVEFIGQESIGRSSRSNPATYIKVYDDIRQLMAKQKRSKLLRLQPRHFSFNVPGGRCEECKGEGEITIEMQFMADVRITCEVCGGKRFKEEVLEVTFQGKNIHEILEMSVDEAVSFFETAGEETIASKLKILQDVGMGYVKLGQSTSTLSGGEAQRMKLASYLLKGNKMEPTLFIFDEPTTGLHFHDINKLLQSFQKLIENGHSIVVIEHHPDVIKSADYIVDLGPEGGDKGGEIVFQGTPEDLVKDGKSELAPYLKEKLKMS